MVEDFKNIEKAKKRENNKETFRTVKNMYKQLGIVKETIGDCKETIWELFGNYLGTIWELFGNYLGTIWELFKKL